MCTENAKISLALHDIPSQLFLVVYYIIYLLSLHRANSSFKNSYVVVLRTHASHDPWLKSLAPRPNPNHKRIFPLIKKQT